ncbi:MAG: hypothetical protein NTZ11_18220 [Gammaproteobacteria bacterium]|nr:hypothetical protein [Gammaproteobacteria bacterium]
MKDAEGGAAGVSKGVPFDANQGGSRARKAGCLAGRRTWNAAGAQLKELAQLRSILRRFEYGFLHRGAVANQADVHLA